MGDSSSRGLLHWLRRVRHDRIAQEILPALHRRDSIGVIDNNDIFTSNDFSTIHGAGAIAALFGLLLVLPLLVLPLPSPWSSDISTYLPSSVGMDLLTPVRAAGSLSPLEAGLIFAAYAVAALVGAFVLTNLRDV